MGESLLRFRVSCAHVVDLALGSASGVGLVVPHRGAMGVLPGRSPQSSLGDLHARCFFAKALEFSQSLSNAQAPAGTIPSLACVFLTHALEYGCRVNATSCEQTQ